MLFPVIIHKKNYFCICKLNFKMKKLFSLIVVLSMLSSCTTEVRFNNPGFQAYRDNSLFRAIDVKAYRASNGVITIQGLAENESVTLSTTGSALGTYLLGSNNTNNRATYTSSFDGEDYTYATNAIHGPVSAISPLSSTGTGYTAGSSVATTTTGLGTGLTVITKVNSSGAVTSVKVSSPGVNYYPGDYITITGGGNNATFYVMNIVGSNGEVDITDNSDGTISGTFKFNAVNTNGNPNAAANVNFQYGTFYKIPVTPAP
jgi:hypothetical protein